MKVRLVKGPFGGKVLDHPAPGRNELIYRGPKRMSRKKQWEMMADRTGYYESVSGRWLPPHVEARYKICMGWFSNKGSLVDPTGPEVAVIHAPLYHPDGSIFYEYVKGSERQYR